MFCFVRWESIDQAEKRNKTKNKNRRESKGIQVSDASGLDTKGLFLLGMDFTFKYKMGKRRSEKLKQALTT